MLAARRRAEQRRFDRGSIALELAIIAPALLALIFFSMQAGLFFYGRAVAVQAAREGVSQLRVAEDLAAYEAAKPRALAYTTSFASTVGGQGLTGAQASSAYDDGEGRVEVTVTGSVITLVPGLNLTTTATASGTVERFRDPEPVP